MSENQITEKYDVVILGSGPAGFTAAIYIARGGFKPLVLTGNQIGGQLTLTTHIENYPGFPEGITGMELMEKMQKQAEKFGTKVATDSCDKIEKTEDGFKVVGSHGEYFSKAVLIATGASALWLPVPGVGTFKNKGVSACAVCDGPFFKDKIVSVIGGGDTAFIEVEFLSRFAKKVFLIHRRENFRGEKIMQNRILGLANVTPLYNSQIHQFLGGEFLEKAVLESKFQGESDKFASEIKQYPEKYGAKKIEEDNEKITWEIAVDGAFMAIGHKPNTDFLKGFLELDELGYVKTKDEVFTSIEGIFACGDVVCNVYKQASIAVGSGCKAAVEIQNYLKKIEN